MNASVNLSLACYPGRTVAQAMALAETAAASGQGSTAQVQICPQNTGMLDVDMAAGLVEAYPDTEFRLHANARVVGWSSLADLASLPQHLYYVAELGRVSKTLSAPAYTIHAGLRGHASLSQLQSNLLLCEDIFDCPVGIEGMYPTADDRYNISTWQEYRAVFERSMRYALDLSHLNILACKTGMRDVGLVREMLASDQCLEIHLSGNDGEHDQHAPVDGDVWWRPLLAYAHPDAVLFTEENRLRSAGMKPCQT